MAVKDEVREKEVTHMYHYHTKATCLQMQTTYSGGHHPPSPPHPAAVLGPPPPPPPQAPPGYYGGPPYPPALPGAPMAAAAAAAALMPPPPQGSAGSAPAPGYGVNHVMPMSGTPVHRHYGSAFTVPHYGHGVPYPQAEYVPGYYQPAGPLIQPAPHDQCLIHKPVPYHPQHRPAPLAPAGGGPGPHPAPPPQGYPPHYRPGPYPPFQPPPAASSSGAPPPSSSAPPLAPPPSTTDSSFQMSATGSAAAVPKSEPVTPPETKSPSQGNEFSDASKAAAGGKDGDGNGATRTTPFQPEAQLSVAEPLVLAKKGPPAGSKPGTTTLPPDTDVLLVGEPVVLARKGPRGAAAAEKQAKIAARTASTEDSRGAEKKSVATKGGKRSLLKASEAEKVGALFLADCVDGTNWGKEQVQARFLLPGMPAGCQERPEEIPAQQRVGCAASRKEEAEAIQSRRPLPLWPKRRHRPVCGEKASPATSSVPPAPHLGGSKKGAEVNTVAEGDQPAASKKVPLGGSGGGGAVVVRSAAASSLPTKSPVVVLPPKLLLSKRLPRRKFAHGWSWDGEPVQKVIILHNEDSPRQRLCFPAMRHAEGDVIRVRDCVLLRSGPRKTDLPFVAKVSALWEGPEDGEMMITQDGGRRAHHMDDEIFASKHRDANSVACIEDKCYVLTFAEYCRYRARAKMLEEGLRPPMAVVPDQEGGYPRRDRLPPGRMDPQMVFFCRRVYDFRQKRILKNPS
ncbi:hypothetical protein HPB48_020035 [Haemaphysalis longicornis]|uniref:BAH domain-containing protein n=1 Tax=Haemaphysalis longicornis TaxID=44386 RepID=A0A9J6GKM1_HAELO|nr:hypothetical protein HPB48_020035 [Haemaphysalis longicornis]